MAISTVRVLIDGTWHTLEYNSEAGAYTTTITAPDKTSYHLADGQYAVTVEAVSSSGHIASTELGLVVKEATPPVTTPLSSLVGSYVLNKRQPFVFAVTDEEDGSGVDTSSVVVSLDGVPVDAVVTEIATGCTVTYSPPPIVARGAHTLTVDVSDNDGNAAARVVVYYGLHLITDRTAADVELVKEMGKTIKQGNASPELVREYLDLEYKGAYTYRDLNRVEEAVLYVATLLRKHGYLATLPPVQTWSVEDKPNQNDFMRYLDNIATLRNAISVFESTPEVPSSMTGLTVNTANDIEQILLDVEKLLNSILDGWFYSGDIYSAEV